MDGWMDGWVDRLSGGALVLVVLRLMMVYIMYRGWCRIKNHMLSSMCRCRCIVVLLIYSNVSRNRANVV
jgi:hypothetical protein